MNLLPPEIIRLVGSFLRTRDRFHYILACKRHYCVYSGSTIVDRSSMFYMSKNALECERTIGCAVGFAKYIPEIDRCLCFVCIKHSFCFLCYTDTAENYINANCSNNIHLVLCLACVSGCTKYIRCGKCVGHFVVLNNNDKLCLECSSNKYTGWSLKWKNGRLVLHHNEQMSYY